MTKLSNRRATSVWKEFGKQAVLYAELMRLNRPVGIWLLLWPTLWGLWIAGKGQPSQMLLVIFTFGVIVMRSAGCVINDFADRKLDRKIVRTMNRPLAAHRIVPAEALVVFAALSLIAIALVLNLNRLSQLLAVIAAALTIIYPYAKRFVSAPQLILGAAFGWGIPMAFAAQTGEIPRLAWLMWLAVVIWAVIYDTMYAMADREEDLKIGIRSTAILFGTADLFIITLLQIVLFLALLLIGAAAKLESWYNLSIGVVALLMIYQRLLIRHRNPERCFQAFLNNQYVGVALFAGTALDYTFS